MTGRSNDKLYLAGRLVDSNRDLVSLYQQRVAAHGLSATTMFYKNSEQHVLKLTQFATLLHSRVTHDDSVLDIGCGYGSLAPLLPPCNYVGIDLVPDFISHAQQRHPLLDFRTLELADYRDVFDWGVLLGVVNGVPDPEALVTAAWRKCRKGLLVDFVDSSKLPVDFPDLNRFEIGECLNSFLNMGAQQVTVFPTASVWTIFVICKSPKWLVSRIEEQSGN